MCVFLYCISNVPDIFLHRFSNWMFSVSSTFLYSMSKRLIEQNEFQRIAKWRKSFICAKDQTFQSANSKLQKTTFQLCHHSASARWETPNRFWKCRLELAKSNFLVLSCYLSLLVEKTPKPFWRLEIAEQLFWRVMLAPLVDQQRAKSCLSEEKNPNSSAFVWFHRSSSARRSFWKHFERMCCSHLQQMSIVEQISEIHFCVKCNICPMVDIFMGCQRGAIFYVDTSWGPEGGRP